MEKMLKDMVEAHGGSDAAEIESVLIKEGIVSVSSLAVIGDDDILEVFGAELNPLCHYYKECC